MLQSFLIGITFFKAIIINTYKEMVNSFEESIHFSRM